MLDVADPGSRAPRPAAPPALAPAAASRTRFLPVLALSLTLVVVLALPGPSVAAADTSWTHYRGSRHDGTYPGPIRTNWSAQAPRRLWRVAADPALSSLTFRDGRLFTQARRPGTGEEREFALALDAASGRELWATDLDVANYINGGVGDDDGPRSTPVVDGDRVYVFSSYLRLHCLEAATGRVVWRRDFRTELSAGVVEWQNAASPVIVGDLILVNGNARPNRLLGIRKSDGTTAWRRHDEQMTQATPTYAVLAGIPHVIFFGEPNLVAVRPDNGDLLWRYPFRFSTSTAASPVVADDQVYCSAAYGVGSAVVRVSPAAGGAGVTVSEVWNKRNANMNHWATPVYHDRHFYGVYGQSSLSLRCIEAATGNEKWRTSTVGGESVGYGSILLVAGQLLVTTEEGLVTLASPDPEAYAPLTSFRALTTGKCWNSPALADGILYLRSTTQIAAYDVAPPAPPPALALSPAVQLTAGTARLTLRAADGSAIPGARASGITLQATDDPNSVPAGWTTLPGKASVVDGAAVIEDPGAATAARRFYRTRE
jgi:outer membrane protein assembly factor BamB